MVLLEAHRLGWGASGRNGGQLASAPRAPMDSYLRALGREDARKCWDISIAANRLVKDLMVRHGIEADYRPGWMEVAWRASEAAEFLDAPDYYAREFGHQGIEALTAAEVADRLGTARYHAGAIDWTAGHLHPLKLAFGLARAAAAAGVRLHEASRVVRVEGTRVETAAGAVTAEHVLLACNGYLDGLVPRVARRSMPINNFIVASSPLSEAEARRINPDDLCVSDTKFVLNYFRLSADRRLLWGGGETYSKRFPKDIAGLVRRAMTEIYPEFATLPITHAWGGTLAITITRMPAFQRLAPGQWAISGWSGSGVHMATMGGQIAAEAIRGTMERWDLMARLPVPPFPGGDWFRAPLLAAAMTWYALRDRF